MRLILLLTFSALAWGQELPNWAGAGTQYGASDSPKWSGWAAMALPISQSQSVYSYTEYQAIPVKGKTPTISTTTGLSTILRTIKIGTKTLYVMGLGTVGAAVSSTATTGSFSGGGGAWLRWPSGFTAEVIMQQSKAAAPAKPDLAAGFGYTWPNK
jgi:hypothetical protein